MTTPLLAPKAAARLILQGEMPDEIRVNGPLLLESKTLECLPARLEAAALDVSRCPNLRALPDQLKVRRLNINGCRNLEKWPSELALFELEARESNWRAFPAGWRVDYRLDLSESAHLERLPDGFKTGSLVLRGCTNLAALPENLDVFFLDIGGCTKLQTWPQSANLRIGKLDAAGCTQLRELPHWLGDLSQLNVGFCPELRQLPEGLRVSSWLDLAESGLTDLPTSLQTANLRWKGVPIDARIAFAPETIRAGEILEESNAEVRRVMLERMGYEKFLDEAEAKTLDCDRDAGGQRRLLRVELAGDEPLVCLSCFCPSTGRQYMLRVPPRTDSCHAAAAWLAGFDNPDDYQPVIET